MALLSARVAQPRGYGRIVRDAAGGAIAITEEADADEATRAIDEINVGAYCFDAAWLRANLGSVPASSSGEYYLTDLVALAINADRRVAVVVAPIGAHRRDQRPRRARRGGGGPAPPGMRASHGRGRHDRGSGEHLHRSGGRDRAGRAHRAVQRAQRCDPRRARRGDRSVRPDPRFERGGADQRVGIRARGVDRGRGCADRPVQPSATRLGGGRASAHRQLSPRSRRAASGPGRSSIISATSATPR